MLNRKLSIFVGLFLLFAPVLSKSAGFPPEIKLMTWNVLNDNDLNSTRGQSVLSVLEKAQANILVLQEVNLSFVQMLKNDHRFSDYRIYSHQQGSNIAGGLAILSKLSLKTTTKYERLSSMMNRGLLYLRIENKEQFLCIANIHLESMMDDTAIRIKQLKSIFDHLRYCDEIILAGDFNFGKNEAEESILRKKYQDVWLQLKPNKRGLTFNRELNKFSDDNAFWFEKSRRLDRIYVNSDCLSASHITLVGDKPDKKGNMPSDHFAVLAEFSNTGHCK